MIPYASREWLPHERPQFPGSPSTPDHPVPLRWAFAVVGALVAITGSLGNAMVTTNLLQLQGALGVTAAEIAWLPAAYVMTNVSANLVLIKFRQQFGLRLFTEISLVVYALVTFAHLFVHGLGSAISVRAAHGIVGAALTTLGVFYMIQAIPAQHRLRALALGIGLSQLGTPLARVISSSLLEYGEWRGLYLFELGLALLSLGGVLLLRLPPGDRYQVFEKLDAVTITLLSVGMALLCAVLSLGRIEWWLEAPWLGWSLAISIVLVVSGIAVEHFRANPLINTRWLGSGLMLRLGIAIVLLRTALSEQSVGAVGFLQAMGLTNDEMRGLFTVVLMGCLLGIAVSAMTVRPVLTRLPALIALGCVMTGALMDAFSNNLTRPAQLMFSQFLIGFGSTFFLAPALIAGVGSVIAQPRNLISFFVMFNIANNVGGLIGSAFLGTFQVIREKYHSSQLVEHLTLLDPQVVGRIQAALGGYAPALTDPALRNAASVRALGAAASREANVLAYNDVYLAIAAIALMTMIWLTYVATRARLYARRERLAAAASAA
ncbi:MFS transporter [Lysobacter niastensis]|uniref:MFS transporter n=1 Tax=Lysobacter niastensis TaxID=380629 RepID=A0ABS0BDH6_9GAMM|nr:MFS transporter [Lysobacter niastensis]MBF6025170.1 MFS transporter [Lysobacter niastensis]